ncbi:MAG TPA: ABC transporter permease [Planctomycetota bacterium]|nr:ABC transporter permease [Planctomycetota bacterium]
MRARRVSAIVLRQLYLMRGSLARVLPLFAWVAVDMVLWGFMSRYLGAIGGGRFDFVSALLGAVLLWDFFTRVMFGVTMSFFEDVWSRNFLNIFATPLTVAEYLAGLVLTGIMTSSLGLVAMLLVATLAFGLSFSVYGALFLPFILVLFLFGIALGIFGVAVVLRLGPASEWLIWPIPMMLAPFACVFYPRETLPAWMRAISMLIPPSHVFEGIRAISAGRTVPALALAAGVALAAAYILAACWFFARTHRHAVRTGLIARYSAETIG